MGSWSVSCGISNIAITSGNKCVLLPLKKNNTETREWTPATLPIFGEYNDYGGIEEIESDDNTKLIEEHFGISIDDFAVFLVDGKFTYDREEASEVSEKMKNLKEAEKWRFMWIDRQVYDFMIINHDEGNMHYGTPEMLKNFGFELIETREDLKNQNPKRYNQLWKKGDVEVFSDGDYLLSKESKGLYYFGKGQEEYSSEYSIETYFDIPKEMEHLKYMTSYEAWRYLSLTKAKIRLARILGVDAHYEMMERMSEYSKDIIIKNEKNKPLHLQYIDNLELYGDRLAQLINILHNLHPMSGQFAPHILYLTPQCGEYKIHQILLEKFAEINKTYIEIEED